MNANYIIEILLTVGIGILTFFLMRTIDELDRCQKDILKIRENFTKFRENYITKEDFFREQNENRRKLDRIMDILLDMKGEING